MKVQFDKRESTDSRVEAGYTFLAIILALLLGGIFIAFNKVNPFDAYIQIFRSVLGTSYGFSETLVKMIPLILTGLSVAIALNNKIWNIGAEGQLYMGAFFATGFIMFTKPLPYPLEILTIIIIGAIGGAFWALIPALLKVKFKINEVITTLLLNYVALSITDYFVFGPWKGKDNFPYTPEFPANTHFLSLPFGRLHIGIIIAIVLVVIVYILFKYHPWGYEVRLTGSSLDAGRYAGIPINRTIFLVFLLSGAFAGIAGVNQICGTEFKFHHFISSGYGFTGIIVAWLAKSNPFIIIFFAFFLSILLTGTEILQITMGLPASVGTILQGLILFCILASELFRNYRVSIRLR